MDKKQLLMVAVLSIAAAFVFQRFFVKTDAPAPTGRSTAAPAEPTAAGASYVYGGKGLTPAQLAAGTVPTVKLGSLDVDDGYKFQLELDPRGAAVRELKLAGYFDEVDHKRTKDKTPEQLQQWSYRLLAPVEIPGRPAEPVLPLATQSLGLGESVRVNTFLSPEAKVTQWESGSDAPPRSRIAWSIGEVTVDEAGTQTVDFTLNLYNDTAAAVAKRPDFRLVKTYTVRKGSHSVAVSLRVENLTDRARSLSVTQYGPAGLPREGLRADVRDAVAAALVDGQSKVAVPKGKRIERESGVKDLLKAPGRLWNVEYLGDNRKASAEPALWAGAGNQFFGSLVYPVPRGLDVDAVDKTTALTDLTVPADQYVYEFQAGLVGDVADPESLSQAVRIAIQPTTVPAGGAATFDFDVYCGPKGNRIFNQTPLYQRLHYSKAIKFRTCNLCLFEPLAHGVMWIIERGGAAIGNYGVIIVLLVLLIRLVLHPITKRSQVNMMKMKDLQPQLQKIQEKHKDNKEAQQKAMMEFWKQHGASPFLGCLPMFLQMPIWIALWGGLSASVVLRHEGLLPFWITDLAGPDTVWAFAEPVTLPLLGPMIGPIVGLNLLPLMLAVSMFLQQKLTPMQSAAAATPEQQAQQKMTMYMMSGMMLLFFYNAPSGLTLYIMASTAGGVLESFYIRKHIREREAAEKAVETKVSAPGKAPRGSRPKKPKGPFKY